MLEDQGVPATLTSNRKVFNWKDVLLITLLGTTLIFAVTSTYYFLNLKDTNVSPQPATPKTSTPSATPSAEKSETADWKTFVSLEGRFKVKYPPNKRVADTTNGDKQIAYLVVGDGIPEPTFIVSVNEGTDPRLTSTSNSKIAKLAGEEWFLYESGDLAKSKSYLLEKGEVIYDLELSWTKKSDQKILEQILSTFKFLD